MGPLRRAHPASGATWNVQVVRGKMSTQCLWHACRALMVGILLMIIGASMATIGYYANDFALGEFRSNTTVRIKNDQRGLHLNNLSYMGPIIMGVGGKVKQTTLLSVIQVTYSSRRKCIPSRSDLCIPIREWNFFLCCTLLVHPLTFLCSSKSCLCSHEQELIKQQRGSKFSSLSSTVIFPPSTILYDQQGELILMKFIQALWLSLIWLDADLHNVRHAIIIPLNSHFCCQAWRVRM